jgi:hypothetical protein
VAGIPQGLASPSTKVRVASPHTPHNVTGPSDTLPVETSDLPAGPDSHAQVVTSSVPTLAGQLVDTAAALYYLSDLIDIRSSHVQGEL